MGQRLPLLASTGRPGVWRRHLASAIILAVLLGVGATGCSLPGRAPELVIDESVAGDLEALAEETWAQFLTVFEARTGCFGDVHLQATRTLDSRALYDPSTATVTVRVPRTAALLKAALVHEWAHHIEFQCEEHEALRTSFLAAMGQPADTPWRPAGSEAKAAAGAEEDCPSERYAESTIVLILGKRQLPTGALVTAEGVRAIESWAAGD